ncbi:hypothetical protein ACLMAJ_12615 [Nocardia sp. KC 131]|uniref:hypothetical protein n=1 Tax=Nocardia arseniciresistens TaxID=3392119 RepID=UPI00398E74E8
MKIGIPYEIKNLEYRLAMAPAGVNELISPGHEVFVESGTCRGSSCDDAHCLWAGATIVSADNVWGTAEPRPEVKEPIAEDGHADFCPVPEEVRA